MPNYYEVLHVSPTATHSEIEVAVDEQYNKIRRLVTHQDSTVVIQANQTLLVLEKIRATLLDADKRASYDAAIEVNTTIGGLIDQSTQARLPAASLPFASPNLLVPPSIHQAPRYLPPTQANVQQMWFCLKCKSKNIVNSQFCKSCGESLAVSCPECNNLVEKEAQFCTHCGVSIIQARQKKELQAQLVKYHLELTNTEKAVPMLDANLPELGKVVVLSGVWALVSLIAGIVYLLTPYNALPGLNLTGLILATVGNTDYLTIGFMDIFLIAGLTILISIALISLALIKKISPFPGIGAIFATILFVSLPKTTQSTLIMNGESENVATLTALIFTGLVYISLTSRVLKNLRYSFEKIKPYFPNLPNLGSLANLLSLSLYLLPLLYEFYVLLILGEQLDLIRTISTNYQIYLTTTNAFLLFITGFLHTGCALLAWNTSRTIETHYKQAVFKRSQKMEKLLRQVKTLEQALQQVNLH